MLTKRELFSGSIIFSTALAVVLLPNVERADAARAAWQSDQSVPAHHTQPPAQPLPDTMGPERFDNPVVKNAYAAAGKVKKVLYQQPCYCHCDRGHGHASLLDCFTSTHGSMCNICIGEALYSYEETRKGKTPAQIREGIEKGEWQKIDGAKYQTYPTKP